MPTTDIHSPTRARIDMQPSASLNVLTVAPMASYPPMAGDSKRIHRVAAALSHHGVQNLLIGKNFVMSGQDDVVFPNGSAAPDKSRNFTGVLALLKGGHYNEVKHSTPKWRTFAEPFIQREPYNFLYCQFLWTYPVVEDLGQKMPTLVDTNNSEWQWYDRFAETSRSPLVQRLCRSSKRRADEILKSLPAGTIMAHVSQSDLEDYQSRRPDLPHVLIPNGSEVIPRSSMPDYSMPGKKTLLFFASLAGKMSLDALLYFAEAFWPALKDDIRFIVAGSHPATKIVEMCAQHGWELRPNLSETEVTELFNSTHFAVLPFTYGVGSKLKLLDAISRGVPVLTTEAGACGQSGMPSFVRISDSPADWKQTLTSFPGLGPDWKQEVERFGSKYTWEALTADVPDLMRDAIARRQSNDTKFSTKASL